MFSSENDDLGRMTLDQLIAAPSLLRLPRELRDQVYGYLLDGAYARVPLPEH